MSTFTGLGPFANNLRISELGLAAARMTKAIEAVPEAYEAARALGDCQRVVKRQEALTILDGLPPRKRELIRAEYLKHCRREVA